eukprot:COSAG04_NODE_24844_length_316_cov_0.709677_1_plen_93_part_10
MTSLGCTVQAKIGIEGHPMAAFNGLYRRHDTDKLGWPVLINQSGKYMHHRGFAWLLSDDWKETSDHNARIELRGKALPLGDEKWQCWDGSPAE